MVDLTARTRLYEVLIRFNADGSHNAHQAYLTDYLRPDGTIEPGLSKIHEASAIDAGNLDGVVSAQTAAMLAHHGELKAQVAEHLKARQDAEAALAIHMARKAPPPRSPLEVARAQLKLALENLEAEEAKAAATINNVEGAAS